MQRFIIVIPVYNAVNYIGKCLDSVLSQDYKNYKAIVIDDHSTDGTWAIIKNSPIDAYHNDIRIGSGLANIIRGLHYVNINKEDIIVLVDGDDCLADNTVLSYLNEIYTEDTWMTYGQYSPISEKYKDYCQSVTDIRTYRKSGEWVTTHLRTYKKWLFDKIKNRDLRDENGEYFKVAWDRAFMYPMIEMAGKHCRFIDKVLYIYNDLNPDCDMKRLPEESEKTSQYIINKPEYKEL